MHQHGYIGRKMRLPRLQDRPAIIIAAFGSSKRGRAALSRFEERLTQEFAEHDIFWASSSEIIRRKTGQDSLQQALAGAEAAGYRKAVVQPLHIFPGTEYRQLAETCEYFPGMRVFLSETLLHRWEFLHELLTVLEKEFLSPDQGLNLLALHGTPLAADPVNIVYLGLDRLVRDRFPNVVTASIEGLPDYTGVLARLQREPLYRAWNRVHIIPMMFLAGLHVEDDLMGGQDSWRADLENLGYTVSCPTIRHDNAGLFKGLALYPEVMEHFMLRLHRTMDLTCYY